MIAKVIWAEETLSKIPHLNKTLKEQFTKEDSVKNGFFSSL